MRELTELLAEIVPLAETIINRGGVPKRATRANAILTAVRPYLMHVLEGTVPAAERRDIDHRQRRWYVSPEFWRASSPGNIDIQVAFPANRVYSVSGELIKHGGDWVTGLNGAADMVADFAAQCGAPVDTFNAPAVRKALANLRPTINRTQGYAKMHRTSADRMWALMMPVWREDAALPEMLETKP